VRVSLFVIAIVLLGTGCGSGDGPARIGTCAPGQTLLTGTGVSVPAAVPAEVVDRGACDAANRAGVPVEAVEIIEARATTWGDGRMGCPGKGGGGYITANVEGFLLVVRAGDRTLEYHTDNPTGRPVAIRLCDP
jgi:hypothetical protein